MQVLSGRDPWQIAILISCVSLLFQLVNLVRPCPSCNCKCSEGTVPQAAPSRSQRSAPTPTRETPPPVIAAASGSPGGPAAGQVQDEATSALLKELGQIKVESKETIVTPPVVEAAAVSRPPIQQQAPVVQQTFQAPPPKQYVPPSAPTTFTQTPKLAQPGQVSFRNQFSQYLQTLQIRGAPICIFLGVGRGMFAQEMMNSFPGIFYLIDPFIHVWKGYDDPSNVGDKEQQMIFEDLRLRLESNPQLTNRYMIVRDFSYSFVDNFENATMDPNQQPAFVYIDANHAEYAFERDVKMWWPIVAQGGVMAGSTYVDSTDGRIKVQSVIDNFARENNLQIFMTQDQPPNWYIQKPAVAGMGMMQGGMQQGGMMR